MAENKKSIIQETQYDSWLADVWDIRHEGREEDVTFYVEEARQAGSPVLELGCGTGRITIAVARDGITIVGVDSSEPMLAVLRGKISKLDGVMQNRIKLVKRDMRVLQLDTRFSLVMIPFRTLDMLPTVDDQRRVLGNIREHLEVGGKLILDFLNPDIKAIAAHLASTGSSLQFTGREWRHPLTGNRVMEWESKLYNAFEQTIQEKQIFEEVTDDGRTVDSIHRLRFKRFIFRYEFEHLLSAHGFDVECLYGSFRRDPFCPTSSELIWVARKRQ